MKDEPHILEDISCSTNTFPKEVPARLEENLETKIKKVVTGYFEGNNTNILKRLLS